MTSEYMIFAPKLQERGPDGGMRIELDPIRSEAPLGAGSGFVAATSAASVNLVLSIPSGKVFLWKYLYANAGTVGTMIFYDGGSVGSTNTTIFAPYIPSVQSAPGGAVIPIMGMYVYSLLLASMGAVGISTVKVGGYMYAQSSPD
jgi:hypothetical protein